MTLDKTIKSINNSINYIARTFTLSEIEFMLENPFNDDRCIEILNGAKKVKFGILMNKEAQ